jgi:hypothetical protein
LRGIDRGGCGGFRRGRLQFLPAEAAGTAHRPQYSTAMLGCREI